jgi:mycothiol synthase
MLRVVTETQDPIAVPGAPILPGLSFRCFRGETDYPAMLAVIEGSKQADGIERTDSLEDVARAYQNLTHCDPYQDVLFAQVHGQEIGYSRVWWGQGKGGQRLYGHFAFLLPDWRSNGIRRTMLRHNERRLREIAAGHPPDAERFLEAWAADTEAHWESLLLKEGYEAIRHSFEMVRPDLENLPNLSLPEGLEVRPARPEHYRAIWRAAGEAFRDEWGYAEDEWTDERFEAWEQDPTFDPRLWQVAWDGDQVAGMVLNFINREENREYGRERGYTEGICVRRPWRRRGLARALIARSFYVHKALGMTEAALGVDTQNPSGALRLYESMGFQPVKRYTAYRKPLA